MKTEKFQRKPFIVDCVQVTEENIKDVADWCKGTITETDPKIAEQLKRPIKTWIQVDVQSPMNDKQCQAFVGDWVLWANRGFKIYTPKAFERTFEPVFSGERPAPKIHSEVPKPTAPKQAITPRVLEALKDTKAIPSGEEVVDSTIDLINANLDVLESEDKIDAETVARVKAINKEILSGQVRHVDRSGSVSDEEADSIREQSLAKYPLEREDGLGAQA